MWVPAGSNQEKQRLKVAEERKGCMPGSDAVFPVSLAGVTGKKHCRKITLRQCVCDCTGLACIPHGSLHVLAKMLKNEKEKKGEVISVGKATVNGLICVTGSRAALLACECKQVVRRG